MVVPDMKKNETSVNEYIQQAIDIVGSTAKLARQLEITSATVYNWLWGKTIPDPINCLKIQKATKGKVKAKDIRPDYEWEKVL